MRSEEAEGLPERAKARLGQLEKTLRAGGSRGGALLSLAAVLMGEDESGAGLNRVAREEWLVDALGAREVEKAARAMVVREEKEGALGSGPASEMRASNARAGVEEKLMWSRLGAGRHWVLGAAMKQAKGERAPSGEWVMERVFPEVSRALREARARGVAVGPALARETAGAESAERVGQALLALKERQEMESELPAVPAEGGISERGPKRV